MQIDILVDRLLWGLCVQYLKHSKCHIMTGSHGESSGQDSVLKIIWQLPATANFRSG